jgi:DNA-binding beta-propeller fold protein YncE
LRARTPIRAALAAVALLGALTAAASATGGLPLRTVRDIPLGGRSPRFDYQSLDTATGTLYVAQQGDGDVLEIDLARNRVAGTIRGLAGVHGVLVAPAIHRFYASAQALHELVVIDTRTHRVIARSLAGAVPDGIAYDPADGEVFVSDERPDGAVTAADAGTGHVLGRIALGGSAGNVQYDAARHRILVGVETRDEIAVIDPVRRTILQRVPVPGCNANHSLLVDDAAHVLLVGCSGNARLVVLDERTFRVLGSVGHAGHVDVLALDPSTQRAYASAEDGIVTVLRLRAGGAPTLLGQTHLAARAHSVAVDPRTHDVYFPLGRSGGASVLRVMRPAAR